MTDFEHKENTGSIFKNDYKKADNHPDYKGKVNANGKLMDIALWVRKSEGGKTYFSVKLSEPFVKSEQLPSEPEDETDLPF